MIKKKWVKFVFRRRVFVILTLLIQIALFFLLIAGAGKYIKFSYIVLNVISVIVCIHVLNKHEKAGYKLTWIFYHSAVSFFRGNPVYPFSIMVKPEKTEKGAGQQYKGQPGSFLSAGKQACGID